MYNNHISSALDDYLKNLKFQIEHPNKGQSPKDWFNSILDFEIFELLHEYWWDETQKAEDWINRLRRD